MILRLPISSLPGIRGPRILTEAAPDPLPVDLDPLAQQAVRAVRLRFQKGLLLWLRQAQGGIVAMTEALGDLAELQVQDEDRSFWWLAQQALRQLNPDAQQETPDARLFCRQLERQIKAYLDTRARPNRSLIRLMPSLHCPESFRADPPSPEPVPDVPSPTEEVTDEVPLVESVPELDPVQVETIRLADTADALASLLGAVGMPLVWLIESSLTVRRYTERLLAKAGYQTRSFSTPAEARLALDAFQMPGERDATSAVAEEDVPRWPQLVMAEIDIPEEEGLDFLIELSRQLAHPPMACVALSSTDQIPGLAEALVQGDLWHLAKPFNETDLLQLLDDALSSLPLPVTTQDFVQCAPQTLTEQGS